MQCKIRLKVGDENLEHDAYLSNCQEGRFVSSQKLFAFVRSCFSILYFVEEDIFTIVKPSYVLKHFCSPCEFCGDD